MITNLFFIILVLLLIGLSGEVPAGNEVFSLTAAAFSYFGVLGLLVAQNFIFRNSRKKIKNALVVVANCEILTFLCLYFFLFHTDHQLRNFTASTVAATCLPLLLYFGALFIYHLSLKKFERNAASFSIALRQIKLLLPYALPILLFAMLSDLLWQFSIPLDSSSFAIGFIFLAVILLLILLMPPVICALWECKPLHCNDLKERLEEVCKKASFSHAGLRQWTLLEQTPTAAILGILPRFRYILFTPALLNYLTPSAIEAVLAHEIGHSQRKHLLFFPIILLGMLLFASFFTDFFIPFFPKSEMFHPLFLFLLYALAIALYYRLVFGFFSRLFERQADLHGIILGIPIDEMVQALHSLGVLTGNSHHIPNWHHFSIAERIAFLKEVEKNPSLAEKYHRKVKFAKALLLLAFALAIAYSFL